MDWEASFKYLENTGFIRRGIPSIRMNSPLAEAGNTPVGRPAMDQKHSVYGHSESAVEALI